MRFILRLKILFNLLAISFFKVINNLSIQTLNVQNTSVPKKKIK